LIQHENKNNKIEIKYIKNKEKIEILTQIEQIKKKVAKLSMLNIDKLLLIIKKFEEKVNSIKEIIDINTKNDL